MSKMRFIITVLLCVLPVPGSVTASFAKTTYSLTAAAGAGGRVLPARATAKPGVQKPVKSFTFAPSLGKGVESITGTYTSTTSYKYVNAITGAVIPSLPAPIGMRVRVAISNVTGDATLTGTFAAQVANAGANQVVTVGAPVTLDGRLSTGIGAYAWTQVSGPAPALLSGAGNITATFTAPDVPGTYLFTLTHGKFSATTTVFVTDSLAKLAKSQCATCHAGQRVGIGVYENWSGSIHSRSSHSFCSSCHVGANTSMHPGTVTIKTIDPKTFK